MRVRQKAILVIAAFAFCGMVQATTYAPMPLNNIRALSQSADSVVVARVKTFRSGRKQRQSDGYYAKVTPDTFICDVDKTLAGSVSLNGKRHFLYNQGGDSYSWTVTNDSFLFFVRRTKAGYELSSAPLLLRDNFLAGWYEGRESDNPYSLHDLLPLIKKNNAIKVKFFGWIPSRVRASGGTLPTAWVFKNIGRAPILILPPSLCFNSLQSRRLRNGKWDFDRDWWQSVDHWDFYTKQEIPVRLAPGEQRTFYYKIPLKTLKMTEHGPYQMTFYYHQGQLSQHAEKAKITPEQMCQSWLGEPPTMTKRVQVF